MIAQLGRESPLQESEWIVIREAASHPFWSRDGRVLYYLATFPSIDIRSRVLARGFDPSMGHVTSDTTEVLTLGWTSSVWWLQNDTTSDGRMFIHTTWS